MKTRDEHGISYGALNWRGNLDDLTADQLRERADAMAWVIANNAARGVKPNATTGRNDPVREFAAARDAWFARGSA